MTAVNDIRCALQRLFIARARFVKTAKYVAVIEKLIRKPQAHLVTGIHLSSLSWQALILMALL